MRRVLHRFFSVVGSVIPAILLGVVLMVVSANVLARGLFGITFHAAHDLALVAFVGVVWFGVVGAALNGQLFGVSFFSNRLPPRWRLAVQLLVHAIVIAIALAVIDAALAQIATARFTRFLALGWPKWIVSAGLLAAMAVLILVQITQAWGRLKAGREDRP